MGPQEMSQVHETKNNESLFIPCACGEFENYLRITYWKDSDPDDFMILGASFDASFSWRGRIGTAWRALRGKPHRDEAIINVETAKELITWLSNTVADYETRKEVVVNE